MAGKKRYNTNSVGLNRFIMMSLSRIRYVLIHIIISLRKNTSGHDHRTNEAALPGAVGCPVHDEEKPARAHRSGGNARGNIDWRCQQLFPEQEQSGGLTAERTRV